MELGPYDEIGSAREASVGGTSGGWDKTCVFHRRTPYPLLQKRNHCHHKLVGRSIEGFRGYLNNRGTAGLRSSALAVWIAPCVQACARPGKPKINFAVDVESEVFSAYSPRGAPTLSGKRMLLRPPSGNATCLRALFRRHDYTSNCSKQRKIPCSPPLKNQVFISGRFARIAQNG
jgi:hypothetical protein